MGQTYQQLVCQQVVVEYFHISSSRLSEIEICITLHTSDNPSGDGPLPLSTLQGSNCLNQPVSIPTVVAVKYSAQTSPVNHRSDQTKYWINKLN